MWVYMGISIIGNVNIAEVDEDEWEWYVESWWTTAWWSSQILHNFKSHYQWVKYTPQHITTTNCQWKYTTTLPIFKFIKSLFASNIQNINYNDKIYH